MVSTLNPNLNLHDIINNYSHQRETDQNPCRAAIVQRVSRAHKQARTNNPCFMSEPRKLLSVSSVHTANGNHLQMSRLELAV